MEPTYLKKLSLLLHVRLLGYQAEHHLAETCRSRPAANHPTGGAVCESPRVVVVLVCRVLPSAMMWWCTHCGSGTCHRLRRAGWCPQRARRCATRHAGIAGSTQEVSMQLNF